jgi:hypothetical protein
MKAVIGLLLLTISYATAQCTGNLCVNGATCVTGSPYTCTCTQAWVGQYCNVSANCQNAPFNSIPLANDPTDNELVAMAWYSRLEIKSLQ